MTQATQVETSAGPGVLTRLGLPFLWGADVEKAWVLMRFNVVPLTTRWLAPGSYAYGLERLPRQGGGVLALNHLSAIDPPLVGAFSNRTIWYMMKSQLGDVPALGEVLGWAGGFPICRGHDNRDGLRNARELVREGHLVGIFVEGARQRLGYPGDVQAGALMVAMRERVPVIPCGIETFGWSLRNRRACAIVWGQPMSFEGLPVNGAGYKEAADILRGEMRRLWRQAAHAVADGFPPALSDGALRSSWPRARQFHRQQAPRRVSGRTFAQSLRAR